MNTPLNLKHENAALFLIGVISLIAQALVLLIIPIGFECDAGMFLNYAKKLVNQNGVYTDGRPPFYPFFLVLTGAIYPGTLILTIFIQSIIGAVMPIILFKAIEPYGKKIAFLSSLILVMSFVPFVGAKLFMAEQVYSFFLLITIYFLGKYIDDIGEGEKRLILFLLFGIIATLTRFEGQLILYLGGLLLIIENIKKKKFKKSILILVTIVTFIFGYSIVRSFVINDFSVIGHLHNSFGAQSFWRIYNLTVDKGGVNTTLLSRSNGAEVQRLSNILEVGLDRSPDYYRAIRNGFDDIDRVDNKKRGSTYHELYGQWDGSGKDLVANMLESRRSIISSNYSVFIPTVVTREIGIVKGDQLLKNVSLEAIKKYPEEVFWHVIKLESLFFGINLEPFYWHHQSRISDLQFWQMDVLVSGGGDVRYMSKDNGTHKIHEFLEKILFIQNDFAYSRTIFNAGNCAENMMSSRMWGEYLFDKELTNSDLSNKGIAFISIMRSYVRILCGIIIIIGMPLIFYRTNRLLYNITVTVVFLITTIALVISCAGPGSKYDIPIFPLFILIAAIIVSNFCKIIKKLNKI